MASGGNRRVPGLPNNVIPYALCLLIFSLIITSSTNSSKSRIVLQGHWTGLHCPREDIFHVTRQRQSM